MTPPPETLTAPPVSSPAPFVGPPAPSADRRDLALETARQPGGDLDPDSWVAPTAARIAPFLAREPDQRRIDGYAYEWLQAGSAAKATGTGGGIDQEFKTGLQTYVDFRKARGEVPFQYLGQARTRAEERDARGQVPFFAALFSDPEKMAEAFPEEHRQAFEDRFTGALDPIADKRQAAGVLLVSTMLGKSADEVADLWPVYRQKYANEHLGLSGPVDDAAFYQAAGKAFQQETKDDETARDIASKAQLAAIQGKPLAEAVATGKGLTGDQWKRFEPAARAAYAGVLSEFRDPEIKAGRALFEAVADMEGTKVEDLAKGDGQKAAWVIALESYGAADQATRDRMMTLIGLQAQAAGENITNYFERVGAATQSGTDMLTSGIGSLGARLDAQQFKDLAAAEQDPVKRKEQESIANYFAGKSTFSQDLKTAGVRVRRYIDAKREGFWDSLGDYSVMAAESLPIMAGAALPYGAGLPAIMTAYGERNLSTLRRAAPNADEASITATAYTSGAIEAGIDRLQWLTLGARLPRLNATLLKYGKPGAVAVGAVRAGVITAAETGQEVLQDLTLPAMQEVAAALDEDIPGPNWSAVIEREAHALGDIAGVSMIFGIIGATGSTITDHIQAPRLAKTLQDRDGMALAGFSPATIEEVATLAETNPAAAAEALRAATIATPTEERQAHSQAARERLEGDSTERRASHPADGRVTSYGYASDTTPDANSSAGIGAWVGDDEAARIRAGENTPNKLRAGDIAVSRDIEAGFRSAGISPGDVVTMRLDDGTEISGRWMDRTAEEFEGKALTGRFDIYSPAGVNPLDGRAVVGFSHLARPGVETSDSQAAGLPTMQKEPDGKVLVNFPDAPAVLVDGNEEALEAVRNWEEQASVDTTKAVREYLDFLTDYHAANPEASFTGRQTTQEPTLESWAGNSKEKIATANARIDIMLRQAGTDMGIDRPLLSDVPILGTSRTIRAGAVTRMVAEIHKSGNPLTVIEEAAESLGKWLMADSKVSEAKMISWIRETEQGTRTKILADDIATMADEARAQEIAEGFSLIARNNAVGKIADSALPSAVKAFFRAFKEQIASVLRLAADFAHLRTEGKVDPEFSYWLDVAAGLESEYQLDNLSRQMEAEQLAESMAGFTEIQDALKGKIPHPATLEAAGDPLAGEVRRLHEGMLENPDNGANKAARTRKVNEFFLPKGQAANLDELRRSLNEQGFDFTTPAEMIEAADLSINYGRKVFGTTDTTEQDTGDDWNPTFSVGGPHAAGFSQAKAEGRTFAGKDGKERFEISDHDARAIEAGVPTYGWGQFTDLMQGNPTGIVLGKILHHPALFEAYPDARGIWVRLVPGKQGGSYDQDAKTITIGFDKANREISARQFSTLLHEVQHWIQEQEDFTPGGNPDQFQQERDTLRARLRGIETSSEYQASAPAVDRMWDQFWQKDDASEEAANELQQYIYRDHPVMKEVHAVAEKLAELDTLRASDMDRYRALGGEKEARGVQARASMTAEERAAKPFMDGWETFSISVRGDPLLAAIEARIHSPEKKAEVYKKMKARVSAVKRRFEERRLRGEFDNDAGAIDQKRFEQIRDIATLEAIAKAMPPEIRGKIVGSFRKVADLKTTKGRQKYITALLPRIENALESMLQRHFRAAIRRQMKQAAFKVADSRTRGGKIGALGHAVFEEAKAAMKLTDDSASQIGGKTAAEKADAKADELRTLLEGAPDLTDEQIAELDGRIAAVELLGDFGNANSARLEEALGFLNGTYTEGRREWLDVLTARRDVRNARVAIVETAMGRAGPITDAERNAMKRRFESTLTRLDEGIMQAGLSGSQKLRRLAELTKDPEIAALTEEMEMAFLDAENAEGDTNDADSKALAAAMRKIFGTSTEYGTAAKLRELTTATAAAPVEKIEGRKVEKVKVPVKFVEAILAGDLSGLEAGGEKFAEDVKAFDDHDLAQLELEWEQFTDLPETEQARKRNVTFERIVADGVRMTIGQVNQLEGLQLYLTMKQPDQAVKLARLGYDETTLAQLEEWLTDEAIELGAWMVDHIGAEAFTLDSIHRAEKGVGLKLVENYFPVRNDVAGADNTGLSINGGAIQHTGKSIGAIKERVSNNAPPAYVNAIAVFLANRAQVNFWKSHVAPLREFGGVIRDERFAAAVKVRMGETYYQSLDTLLKRIESGGALNAAKLLDWEKLVKSLTSSFAIGTLGGRVSTLAVNVAAGLNVGLEIPANELAAGIAEVFARPEAFKDAFNSPAIQRRLHQGASYEAQLAKAGGPSRNPTLATLNSAAQKGVMPINYVDTGANVIGAAVVWEHTRKNSLRAGMTEEQARTAADQKVTRLLLRSAQPTTRLAKSEMELKAAENPLAALFTLFTSEPRKTLAILYMSGRELTTGKGTYGKPMAAQQLFVAFVIFQTADFMIRQAYAAAAKADDDEPEDFLSRLRKRIFDPKAWAHALTTSHLRSVPIGGEVWNQTMAKAFDQKAFTSSQNPLNRAAREVLTFEEPETTEEAVEGAIDILQGVGPVIPGGALFAQGGNLAEFVSGVATSNGVSFSDEDRVKRLKSRFSKFAGTLDDIHGKTQQPTGKTGSDGKPATKTDKAIQATKHAAMVDHLRADLAPLAPELRKQTLDAVTAPQEVKDKVRKLVTAPKQ
ncbi:MAG: hypothetical protein V4819_00980 [Verrucomicrobiota bacterium]